MDGSGKSWVRPGESVRGHGITRWPDVHRHRALHDSASGAGNLVHGDRADQRGALHIHGAGWQSRRNGSAIQPVESGNPDVNADTADDSDDPSHRHA